MRQPRILLLAVLSTIPVLAEEPHRSGTGPQHLPANPTSPSNDILSDEELITRRNAGGTTTPKFLPRKAQGFSLKELSQFLGTGESSVILPKGSVIHCPEPLAARVVQGPQGTLMSWPDFLIAHRGWLTTREVTPDQIRGDSPFSETDRTSFQKGGKVVIATFRGSPVTVLPPRPVTVKTSP